MILPRVLVDRLSCPGAVVSWLIKVMKLQSEGCGMGVCNSGNRATHPNSCCVVVSVAKIHRQAFFFRPDAQHASLHFCGQRGCLFSSVKEL